MEISKYRHVMTESQEELLKLLKEIDAICRENEIRYFLDSGTVLGALRHEGFIPWDNDLDIVMTMDNYKKFRDVCNSMSEKTGRIVRDSFICPDQRIGFRRYIAKDSTKLVRTSQYWNTEDTAAGQSIDILPLIPLPKDPAKKAHMLNLFMVYEEFVNEITRRRAGRSDEFIKAYKEAERLSKKIGKDKVLQQMRDELFNQDPEEDFDEYLYGESGRRVTLVDKREWYDGKPVYLKFEDAYFPVQPRFIDIFLQKYGDDYYMIPDPSGQRRHTDMNSRTIGSDVYVNDYMRLISKEEMLSAMKHAKDVREIDGWMEKKSIEKIYGLASHNILRKIQRKIENDNLDLNKLLEEHNTDVLGDLFEEYYEAQFSTIYIYWAYIVELPEKILYVALMNYIYQGGNPRKIRMMMLRYKEIHGELTPAMKKVEAMLDVCFTIQSAFDYKEYDRGLKALEEGEKLYSDLKVIKVDRVKYDTFMADSDEQYDKCEELINRLLEEYKGDLELKKYLGDVFWKRGNVSKAKELYEEVYDDLRNGMLRLDIEHKMLQEEIA